MITGHEVAELRLFAVTVDSRVVVRRDPDGRAIRLVDDDGSPVDAFEDAAVDLTVLKVPSSLAGDDELTTDRPVEARVSWTTRRLGRPSSSSGASASSGDSAWVSVSSSKARALSSCAATYARR